MASLHWSLTQRLVMATDRATNRRFLRVPLRCASMGELAPVAFFHLLKYIYIYIYCLFPLLISTRIDSYYTGKLLFSRGLKQTELRYAQLAGQ